ncbi:MAG: hypothetical protein SF182_11780 [Deltaproteobacteria bacterium]|nr:hypothetical protein [Deltaproteobacteria bacterium]
MTAAPRRLLVALLLALAGCSSAARPPATVQAPPPDSEADIADAERLGQMLFVHDMAAWQATDALARAGAIQADSPVRGWITVPQPTGMLVRFIGAPDGTPVAFYDVMLTAHSPPAVQRWDRPAPLPADQAAAARARATAMASATLDCSDRYNTVVFRDPMAAGDDWLVYILPATTVTGRIMVGRHERITVSEDGNQVRQRRALSQDCGYIDQSGIPAGASNVTLALTNLATPTPNESHVFLTLSHRLPFAVGTALGGWMVRDGRIAYLGPTPLAPPP